ncbi:hypothetical protein CEUSTIGMA_g1321.t1 [Chlamydomonas eustigma]|uniref:Rubisco LSMT substrate-binding domain-containing protein n=1 Tax=Chlamydomonas eustigma TaxID=1157962 RepID=A0A250WSU8_9CHLO|nr:hypothetical protein CEUSTIGMA_g1321.t1 [Chlamydomonas eustigma]|eukprot:GAX73871.1 hypothetical protein CEUSTIGMA_g1321.t1 [Chlamydomonas eustigma]
MDMMSARTNISRGRPVINTYNSTRQISTRLHVFVNKGNVAAKEPDLYDTMSKVIQIKQLVGAKGSVKHNVLDPKRFTTELGERVGFITTTDLQQDEMVISISEEMAITSIDAENHEVVGGVASSCGGELVALTLWLMAEREKGADSAYANLLATLPDQSYSTLLWTDSELETLLSGSPVLAESRNRVSELKRQWQELYDGWFSKDVSKFKPDTYNYEKFAAAFCVVLAHTVYLPSAQLFALLPLISLMGRTGNANGCDVDYDSESKQVFIKAGRPYREGQEVLLNDVRPNGELLMATGTLPETNTANFINFPAALIPADKYFVMKSQILESMGFSPQEYFPVFPDRMPNQLLAYIRLARVQDPALFAKVSFEQDIQLSQMNEYEVLQLLMGDCRERLACYRTSMEEDIKLSQQRDLSVKEKLAVKLRLSEKRIISSTMDAVRQRLAPIRGIPTKAGGMQDPNSDLAEIFQTIESIPNAPKKLFEGLLSWAKGEQDPDWGKGPIKKPLPKKPW